jgi:glucan 1,3-beta-glucosidase
LSAVIEEHYSTFIVSLEASATPRLTYLLQTEKDFAQMAAAGLNWIRLPIPYWFIETQEGEPFLEGVGWKYVLKAFEWCRKYGLRIELDIHALPGSQNGQNHSGFVGGMNWLGGEWNIALLSELR